MEMSCLLPNLYTNTPYKYLAPSPAYFTDKKTDVKNKIKDIEVYYQILTDFARDFCNMKNIWHTRGTTKEMSCKNP